nr:hypothetical protein [Tanacetum cinerariifolium]
MGDTNLTFTLEQYKFFLKSCIEEANTVEAKGTWSTLISNDMDSNESDDDHDKEEHRSTNEDVDPNAALDDFIQRNIVKESALKYSKEGDQANVSIHVAGDNETLFSGKVKEEYFVTKEDKPSEEDVSDTDYASWDLGQMHMVRSGCSFGTIPVCVRVQEIVWGRYLILAGKSV